MPVVRCEPEAIVFRRASVENPMHLNPPDPSPGFHNYFIEAIVNNILENLKLGLELDDCADLVSVPRNEVKYWESHNTGNFANLSAKARAEFKRIHLMKLTRGKADWKPSAFLLERKFRKEYGKELKIEQFITDKQVMKIGGKEIEF